MDLSRFTESVMIRGEQCLFDPKSGEALLQCERCGHQNVVEVDVVDGEARFMGFSCENCGTFNAPD